MVWYARTLFKDKGELHYETAKLLMKCLDESIRINKNERYVSTEHSYTAIKRRILQIRQELLLVEKSLDGTYQ